MPHTGSDTPMSANADQAEIAKFQALAHRWWDPNSEFRPLHEINPLRLNWIDEQAALAGKRVVDIGCGGGILAESMSARDTRHAGTTGRKTFAGGRVACARVRSRTFLREDRR